MPVRRCVSILRLGTQDQYPSIEYVFTLSLIYLNLSKTTASPGPYFDSRLAEIVRTFLDIYSRLIIASSFGNRLQRTYGWNKGMFTKGSED